MSKKADTNGNTTSTPKNDYNKRVATLRAMCLTWMRDNQPNIYGAFRKQIGLKDQHSRIEELVSQAVETVAPLQR